MRAITLFVLLAGPAAAQTAPPLAFEVASVRINEPFLGRDNRWQGTIETTPVSLIMRKVTWFDMLMWAYRVPMPQIAGPSWFELETYEIVAKASRPAQKDEMRAMLQSLLAERFKLACHRDTREIAGLVLTEAKGGHKMKAPDSDDQHSVTMSELADLVAFSLRIPVSEMTGLTDRYCFTFSVLRPYLDEYRKMLPYDPVAAYQAGLQKELGLKLEARKVPIGVIVIDHVERKPLDN
jgi:uncharacterized protein (TIGR03435 family)